MKKLKFKLGVNPIMMQAVAARTSSMKEKELDIAVIYDECALQVEFSYDETNDPRNYQSHGFVDLAGGDRRNLMAEEVMTVMIRSIYAPLLWWLRWPSCSGEP